MSLGCRFVGRIHTFFSFLSSSGFLLVSRFLVFHGDSLTKMFLIICSIPWGRRLVDWLVQEACKILLVGIRLGLTVVILRSLSRSVTT